MYAVIKAGGKQYKVQEGDIIRVEKLDAEEGSTVQFNEVLALSNDNGLKVGTPLVEGAAVEASVMGHGKGKKIIVFKYKPKKNYRKKVIVSPIPRFRSPKQRIKMVDSNDSFISVRSEGPIQEFTVRHAGEVAGRTSCCSICCGTNRIGLN